MDEELSDKTIKKMNGFRMNGKVNVPPLRFDISDFTFDSERVNVMEHNRNMSEHEARTFLVKIGEGNERMHHCPLLNKTIDDVDCADVAIYAEGDHHKVPMKEALAIEGFEEVCNNCPYHIWD